MANQDSLTPWKKGQSGNLKGKPKGTLTAKTILKKFLAVESPNTHPATGEKMNCLEHMILKGIQAAMNGDLASFKEILNRYEGQANQPISIKSDCDYDFSEMSREQLEEFIRQHTNGK